LRQSEHNKMSSNLPPDAKLTRLQLAATLTDAGFPITVPTLASMATRGGGPPFQHWGPRCIYTWETSLRWAEQRLSAPADSTSAAKVRRKSAGVAPEAA
jgi:hypothetical protein